MDLVQREYYSSKIDSWIGKEQIIVLTGQRRVGKSYLLKDFIDRHNGESDANIIYIDKEKKKFDSIKTYIDLNNYIDSQLVENKHHYILIDEIQDVEGWERSVRSYRTDENTDVIVTGSNSKMLSGELGTIIGGRYQEIKVQSLTYLEFLKFHNLKNDDDSLWKYLNFGGLPGLKVIGIDDEEHVWEYIKGVFNTVMLKDIVERHDIRNVPFLNNLITYLSDTEGKPTSATNISNTMKANGQSIATKVVQDYISYFVEAFLLYEVNRFDIHGKKLFETNCKYYFEDVGVRNLISKGERTQDIEKVIENVVFNQLVHDGYDVNVGQLRAGEVDFVCTKTNSKCYIQTSWLIASDETREREFGRLKSINDNYPKYVISMSPLVKRSDDNGITHIGLREFLANGL